MSADSDNEIEHLDRELDEARRTIQTLKSRTADLEAEVTRCHKAILQPELNLELKQRLQIQAFTAQNQEDISRSGDYARSGAKGPVDPLTIASLMGLEERLKRIESWQRAYDRQQLHAGTRCA